MYTRSYFPEEEKVIVPENYDGSAFSERVTEKDVRANEDCAEKKAEPAVSFIQKEESENEENAFSPLSSVFERLPFKKAFSFGPLGALSGIFTKGPKNIKIGTEEILLAALAIYLFLSKDGDKECALMLLLLIFIG